MYIPGAHESAVNDGQRDEEKERGERSFPRKASPGREMADYSEILRAPSEMMTGITTGS